MKTQAKHTPIPYKACKSHEDFNGPYFDIEEEDRAEYDAKPYTSIESASGIVCTAHDLFTFKPGDAEFIVKACNSYEKFIELAHMVAGKMYDDGVGRGAVQLAEELLDDMGIQRWNGPNLQSTCKPLTS